MLKPTRPRKNAKAAFSLSEEDSRLFRETVGAVSPVASDRVLLQIIQAKPRRRRAA